MPGPFIGMSLKEAKEGFFDRAAVTSKLDGATRKALGEAGRLVRSTAQKSLVYGDTSAPAGSPPHAHRSRTRTRVSKRTGKSRTRSVSFLREFLLYSYDAASRSVVVGPVRLDGTIDPRSLAALEYGGPSTILDHGKQVVKQIAAHPLMGPAYASVQPQIPKLWENSVR